MDIFTFPDGTQDFTYAYFAMIGLFIVTWFTIFTLKRAHKKAKKEDKRYTVYEMGETKKRADH
ncbi:hypothetical protein [Alteribacter populi]|uniref:hypothetical protein n=1 Tax=Alteribacter populi TaxID=2011011 RepID=UPI000BBAEA92|nr:hypothetical protein [Alteribacter populi]